MGAGVTDEVVIAMRTKYISIVFLSLVVLAILLRSESKMEIKVASLENEESMREKFWDQNENRYTVPLTLLMASPLLWQGEEIATHGYLQAGAGTALLTLAPPSAYQAPEWCAVSVSFGEKSQFTHEQALERGESLVRVMGKLIVLGTDNTSGAYLAIVDSNVVFIRSAKRR